MCALNRERFKLPNIFCHSLAENSPHLYEIVLITETHQDERLVVFSVFIISVKINQSLPRFLDGCVSAVFHRGLNCYKSTLTDQFSIKLNEFRVCSHHFTALSNRIRKCLFCELFGHKTNFSLINLSVGDLPLAP